MVGAIVYQLTRNVSPEDIKKAGWDAYFIDHTTGVYPVAASGTPFSAEGLAVTGDPIADLNENLAADAANGKSNHLTATVVLDTGYKVCI